MSIFLEDVKTSTKCHRKKHQDCKNKFKNCGCMCHRVEQLNQEKTISDMQILDDYICKQFKEFWRPFMP